MNLLCLGHASYDITLPVTAFPTENTKVRIGNKVTCGGGPASNAAYLMASWKDSSVSFVGVVGDDEAGHFIKNEMDTIGINTEGLVLSKQFKTTESYIIANTVTGTRTILTARAPNMEKAILKELDEVDAILVDGEELSASIDAFGKYPNAIKVIDAGRVRESTLILAEKADYVVCSKDFAEEFTHMMIEKENTKSIQKVYDKMKEHFSNHVIITLEEKGCFTKIDDYQLISSIKVKAVDTTGAGDIFHGAFTYFITKGYSLPEALRLANITGALSTLKIGGRYSCPPLDEVLAYHKKHDVS